MAEQRAARVTRDMVMKVIDTLRPSLGGKLNRGTDGGLAIAVVQDGKQIAFDCVGGISNDMLAAARERAFRENGVVVAVGIIDGNGRPRPDEELRICNEITAHT